MTDPRRQAFAPYARKLADLMGLRDWAVEIDDEGPTRYSSFATARPTEGRKHLGIDLSGNFLDASPRDQRQSLVHELIHAHTAAMNYALDSMLSPEQYKLHVLNMEYMVDGIAEAWAETLPLPGDDEKATGETK